ncbi:LUD domain-containing protein [uncultured Sunxiuqinia sp.]|jgi:L-lactate dehydrogenase complex protein LldG|uniref:LutC/YkgG family protein n=1 Tax=uncultured Sunxiuqinia sp. TaxID=1573825 RepID=UPI0019989EA5|nr:LUD domain-containing protein [Sunxiuqinia sp.]|tara:strand:- start:46401 stop:47036 length:636 start_codon:yes stop_codon:yes gene_type:complete
MNSSREKILNRLTEAQSKRGGQTMPSPDFESAIYLPFDSEIAESFKTNLELIGGQVIRVKNLNEAITELQKLADSEKLGNMICLHPQLQKVLQGKLAFTASMDDLQHIDVGITTCEFLVAHLGSILVSSASLSGRRLNVFPEIHVVIAHNAQLVDYLDDALAGMEEKYPEELPTMITTITGPSRTADIEKTLVMGMHGPKKLFVLLADEPF